MRSQPTTRARRWLGATTVLLAVFAAHAAYPFGPPWFDEVVARWVNAAVCVLPGLVLALHPPGRDAVRRAWRLMGMALLLWGAGNTYFLVVLWDADSIPIPSPADGFWFAFYFLSYAALVLLMRTRLTGARAAMWLDGVIAATAVAAVAIAVVLGAVSDAVGGSTLAVATNLSYPLMDVVLGAMVIIALAAFGWKPGRAWAFIAVGYGTFAVADSVYLYQSAAGTYVPGNLPDVGWPLAMLLVAYAAVQPAPGRSARLEGWLMLAFPAGASLLSIAVLVYDHFERLHLLAVVLSGVSLAAIVARLALTFSENLTMLAQSRVEAATDALTGLANRRSLLVDLESALGGTDEPERMLVLLDLDGFKSYNDTFGHLAGDTLLRRLGERFNAALGDRTAYRLGGDEFCALVEPGGGDARHTAAALARTFEEDGDGFTVRASYGFVLLPAEAATPADALRLADQRMYGHKRRLVRVAGQEAADALSRALTERSPALGSHLEQVAAMALDVARRLDANLDLDELSRVANLHDVGKIAIPDAILDKPGALEANEWDFIRQHTTIGERIVGAAPALASIAPTVRATHENFDGTGYPDGLSGDAIPLAARIVFACDAFDAMTSDRPYARRRSQEEALAELRRCAGTQFDPAVVEALEAVVAARPRMRLAS